MNFFRKRTRVSYPMTFGAGILGATGGSPEAVRENRLLEIERRILALEAANK